MSDRTLPSAAYFTADEIRQASKAVRALVRLFPGVELEPVRSSLLAVAGMLDGLREQVVAGDIPVTHPSVRRRSA